MAFWTTATEPKRQFRFKVQISSFDDGATWYAKSVTKPSFEISEGQHKYLGHTFHFPGSLTWQPVTCTLVDPVSPDATDRLMTIIAQSGYKIPIRPGADASDEVYATLGKTTMSPAIGEVRISQLDADGGELETFVLKNPIITGINFGDLNYESDELSSIEITFAYDWCEVGTTGEDTYFSDQG
tara:strand:- start:3 stop:554 length:552 start_codon:yes stop_codon:yes gene_type:complete